MGKFHKFPFFIHITGRREDTRCLFVYDSHLPIPHCSESLNYRIGDAITYSVTIEEFSIADSGDSTTTTTSSSSDSGGRGGQAITSPWTPYIASDVQLEFVMLDAYVRVNLTSDAAGRYSANFRAPDVPGVYHFRLHYRRPGYTVLHHTENVSVRPFRRDEFARFLPAAAPYYAAVFT